jgi:hypothetical protein
MLATMSQAVDEWARNVGHYPRFIAHQWLLHDYDVWVRNPHYTGPDQGHPEDDELTPEQEAAFDFAERCADDTRDVEYWANVPYLRVR